MASCCSFGCLLQQQSVVRQLGSLLGQDCCAGRLNLACQHSNAALSAVSLRAGLALTAHAQHSPRIFLGVQHVPRGLWLKPCAMLLCALCCLSLCPVFCAAAEGGGCSGHPAWSYGQQGQLRGVAPSLAGGWRAGGQCSRTWQQPQLRSEARGGSLGACSGTHIARWGWASQRVGPLIGLQAHCDRA